MRRCRKENRTSDLIDRQAVIDALDKRFDSIPMEQTTEILLLRKDLRELPSAQPDLISVIQNGIKATDADDEYSRGMRNGMRWCKSLIDGKEPLYENCPSAQPLVLTCDGCRHVGTYDTDFPCSGCIRREKDYYEQER